MRDVEGELNQKVEERFQESKRELLVILDQIASTVTTSNQTTSLASANALFRTYGAALERVGVELPSYCNRAIAAFKEEISDASEPAKSNAIEKFTKLLSEELLIVLEDVKNNAPKLDI